MYVIVREHLYFLYDKGIEEFYVLKFKLKDFISLTWYLLRSLMSDMIGVGNRSKYGFWRRCLSPSQERSSHKSNGRFGCVMLKLTKWRTKETALVLVLGYRIHRARALILSHCPHHKTFFMSSLAAQFLIYHSHISHKCARLFDMERKSSLIKIMLTMPQNSTFVFTKLDILLLNVSWCADFDWLWLITSKTMLLTLNYWREMGEVCNKGCKNCPFLQRQAGDIYRDEISVSLIILSWTVSLWLVLGGVYQGFLVPPSLHFIDPEVCAAGLQLPVPFQLN